MVCHQQYRLKLITYLNGREWQGKEIGEKKEWQGKKLEVPVIVHLGASSVQLFTSVTNGKLAHPVGGGDVMKRFINFLFKEGLGLDCDCLFLFFCLHPLGPLNKV